MKPLSTFLAVFVTLLFLPGCGSKPEEEPAEPSLQAESAAGASMETESETAPPGEAQEGPPAGESGGSEPSQITTEEELRAALKAKNPAFAGDVAVQTDGRNILAVGLSDPGIEDISPLKGLPLQMLELMGCHVTDISPLEGMPLRVLGLEQTGAKDISPLKGMPLVELSLSHTRVEDLSPLEGAPLEKLYLVRAKVTDLGPLAGMKRLQSLWLNDTPVSDIGPLQSVPGLVSLTLAGTNVSDLSPLKGLGLKRLHIARSQVTDLEPLKWLNLERLVFTPGKIEKGIELARNMGSLREIGTSFGEEAEGRRSDVMPPSLFWEQYDAGKLK